jgi:hypothetical protein
MSGEPMEQRSDAPTVDCVNSKKRTVQKSEVRAAKSERTGHVRCSYKTKDFNGQPLQTPTGR